MQTNRYTVTDYNGITRRKWNTTEDNALRYFRQEFPVLGFTLRDGTARVVHTITREDIANHDGLVRG